MIPGNSQTCQEPGSPQLEILHDSQLLNLVRCQNQCQTATTPCVYATPVLGLNTSPYLVDLLHIFALLLKFVLKTHSTSL